jgi:hypothetical protein
MRQSLKFLAMGLLFPATLILVQPVALADIQMTFNSAPQGYYDGVGVSPYAFTIDGNSPVYLVCDDYATEIGGGETWYANQYGLGDVVANGPQKFTVGATTDTDQLDYTAAGLAAEDILYYNQFGGWSQFDFAMASWAIWNIFDPGAINTLSSSSIGGTCLYGSELEDNDQACASDAESSYLSQAALAPYVNLVIYTPCAANGDESFCTDPASPSGKGVAQEFLGISRYNPPIVTPEGSSLATLGFDLFAVFAGVFLLRKRILT